MLLNSNLDVCIDGRRVFLGWAWKPHRSGSLRGSDSAVNSRLHCGLSGGDNSNGNQPLHAQTQSSSQVIKAYSVRENTLSFKDTLLCTQDEVQQAQVAQGIC